MAGFDSTDFGDRSTDKRAFCTGDGNAESDLVDPVLPSLLTLEVAGVVLLFGVSDKPDLLKIQNSETLEIQISIP